jgi:hypothetical protein
MTSMVYPNKFSAPIEALSVQLAQALERAAEHLETCRSHPRVSDAGLVDAAAAARDLASEIGSKSAGDERLDHLLRVLTDMGL